ncbi:MAG: hypoxanthine phosphoribosyltransferase [Ruminococcus sp.]|nr:hypoxanthine phosphoribosyltransferase [Ruminococcus sp.]
MKDINDYRDGIKRIVISEEEIRSAVKKAGAMISEKYKGEPVLLVSVLKGAFIFLADLARAVDIPCEIDFMEAKSYFADTKSSGSVAVTMDLKHDVSKYHVIIVEDIIDTGRTLKEIAKIIKSHSPLSLSIVTLLDKPSRRVVELNADYSLFTIPDLFVIGYGLDFDEYYRNLPYIAEFDESRLK